jgi:hypothetical protein
MMQHNLLPAALLVSIGLGVGAGLMAAAAGGAARPADSKNPSANDAQGSIQSIRGIEGIDSITLQNLETVLRMQSRATEQRPRGTVRAAAALMAKENTQEEQPEEMPDARVEYLEFEMEGS